MMLEWASCLTQWGLLWWNECTLHFRRTWIWEARDRIVWSECLLPPQNSYVYALTLCYNIWRWGLWEAVKMRSWGWAFKIGLEAFKEEENILTFPQLSTVTFLSLSFSPFTCTKGRPCEDIAGRGRASQKGTSHQEPNVLTPWTWTSQLPDWKKRNSCPLSHTVYGALLLQAELAEKHTVHPRGVLQLHESGGISLRQCLR